MFKSVSAAVLLAAGLLFIGPAPEAKAGTTYIYHTIHPVTYARYYRDVTRTRYVTRIHRVVHVTLVKPIRYVSVVTRVHYRTVAVWRRVDIYVRKVYPTRYFYRYTTVHY
jgi:hypothetical protein